MNVSKSNVFSNNYNIRYFCESLGARDEKLFFFNFHWNVICAILQFYHFSIIYVRFLRFLLFEWKNFVTHFLMAEVTLFTHFSSLMVKVTIYRYKILLLFRFGLYFVDLFVHLQGSIEDGEKQSSSRSDFRRQSTRASDGAGPTTRR